MHTERIHKVMEHFARLGRAPASRGMAIVMAMIAALVLAGVAPVASAQEQAPPRRAAGVQTGDETDQPAEPEAEEPAAPRAEPTATIVEDGDDPLITFSETSEPMDLTALVDLVANTLHINVSVRGELRGSVLFNTAQSVHKSKLLPLLDAMLEQNDFSITYDESSGFYLIQPKANVPVVFTDELATTKLIEIPSIKPSSLSDAIGNVLGGQATGVSYLDELGLLIITNTPRQIARVEELINRVVARQKEMTLTPIELKYISALAARERLIALVGADESQSGGVTRQPRQGGAPNQAQPNIGPSGTNSLENMAERLSVDPQSNALLFRGTPDELERVMTYVAMIDRPNTLKAKRHFVGSAARQIAELASGRGLGEVIVLEDTSSSQSTQFTFNRNAQQQGQIQQTDSTAITGPTLVVDVKNGEIVYYGTADQQETLAEMISTLDTESDRVVIRSYKLHHAVAEDVATVITSLLTGQTQSQQQGGLLPQSRNQFNQAPQFINQFGQGGGEGEIGPFDPTRDFVVADTPNNQIIVKAPVKQQEDFQRLIERLDLRRRQVYIEALIVSVTDNEDFRLAIDAQFKAGQFVGQTNFGLTDVGTALTTANLPLPGLGGLTTSLIKSQYLPFVLNAIKNETDGRILSRPQLLVNDNEEASIVSTEERQTLTQTQGTGGITNSIGTPVTAGTTLTVTPGISEAGFLRLEYEITFDNFIGTGSDTLPPPANRRQVTGSVTMPSDATIVVGGLTVEDSGSTIVKVPILGDLPILGPLFSDTNKTSSSQLLYIFITPKILVDPDFRDLRLITEGPQDAAQIDQSLPPLEPVAINRFVDRPDDEGHAP
ncbi:MAG: hypothetical protein H6810_07690 [Phycisphaeraceae bacterium]|nr:MAG: hypothetical protein H6810_07690 [Phycisphaeraceae bacterium]